MFILIAFFCRSGVCARQEHSRLFSYLHCPIANKERTLYNCQAFLDGASIRLCCKYLQRFVGVMVCICWFQNVGIGMLIGALLSAHTSTPSALVYGWAQV